MQKFKLQPQTSAQLQQATIIDSFRVDKRQGQSVSYEGIQLSKHSFNLRERKVVLYEEFPDLSLISGTFFFSHVGQSARGLAADTERWFSGNLNKHE